MSKRRLYELRSFGNVAPFLDLDKYNYHCPVNALEERAHQIVKEAGSQNRK